MDEAPCPKGLSRQDQADIMAVHEFQSNPCKLPEAFWRDMERHKKINVPLEQLIETRRGSYPNGKAVVSWTRQEDINTANGITVEASDCTIAEARIYRDYLQKQGKKYCGIN